MHDEGVLRRRKGEAIRTDAFPNDSTYRTWGGPGSGSACALCAVLVPPDQLEVEVEFDRTGARYHAHVGCFMAWEGERRRAEFSRAPGEQPSVTLAAGATLAPKAG